MLGQSLCSPHTYTPPAHTHTHTKRRKQTDSKASSLSRDSCPVKEQPKAYQAKFCTFQANIPHIPPVICWCVKALSGFTLEAESSTSVSEEREEQASGLPDLSSCMHSWGGWHEESPLAGLPGLGLVAPPYLVPTVPPAWLF